MAFLGGGRSGAWGRLLLSRVLAFSRLPLGCVCVCVCVCSLLSGSSSGLPFGSSTLAAYSSNIWLSTVVGVKVQGAA